MHILLVEDSRSTAAVLMARLESFGHTVQHATDGKAALEIFAQSAPDLILMDIEMPGMNGFEATTHIRAMEGGESWAWTPIIFLTASDTSTNLITAIEAGGDDFLSKSIPEPVLQAKMKAMARIASIRRRLSDANRHLQDQANRDGLTGLCNRRHMDFQVDTLWEDIARRGGTFGLLMIDVDNFKKFNDFYGHQMGDDCLRGVAGALRQTVDIANQEGLSKGAFAARYGGEEFSVIVPNPDESVLPQLADRILDAIRALEIAHVRNANWGIVTASIGGVRVTPAASMIKEAFRQADNLLYRAKDNGRNRAEL